MGGQTQSNKLARQPTAVDPFARPSGAPPAQAASDANIANTNQ